MTDKGKYEELIVCSHEIAASTAQLVAASKVNIFFCATYLLNRHNRQEGSEHLLTYIQSPSVSLPVLVSVVTR